MSHIAIVTGAGSGVGKETARLLREAGDVVIGVDAHWGDEFDATCCVQGDVRQAQTWDDALASAGRYGGAPSKLVLNAGLLVVGSLLDVSMAQLREVFDVNVFAVALGLQKCVPPMIADGGGSIVAVASVDAFMVEQGLAAYCSSKGALLQLVRSVALDYARSGLRVNCVCPGAIDTPFFQRHVTAAADSERFLREKIERHPAGRILTPVDVAAVVEFLLDSRSLGMNGSTVTVDGGLTSTFDFQSSAVPAVPSVRVD